MPASMPSTDSQLPMRPESPLTWQNYVADKGDILTVLLPEQLTAVLSQVDWISAPPDVGG